MATMRKSDPAAVPRELGIAGLGSTAWPFAERLVRIGHRLAVFDADQNRIDRFVATAGAGAASASTAAMLGARGLVLLGPSEPGAVDLVGMLEPGLVPGVVVVDLGARDPAQARALGARLARRGVVLIDAPAWGHLEPQGLAVGCDDESALAQALPVLHDLGLPVFLAGGSGGGQALRLLASHVRARAFSAAAEALLVADALRLAPAGARAALELAGGLPLDAPGLAGGAGQAHDFASGLALGLFMREAMRDPASFRDSPALTRLLIEFAIPNHNQETSS